MQSKAGKIELTGDNQTGMTPPELLLQAVRLLEFSKTETFADFVHEDLRLLSIRLIEVALEELAPPAAAQPLQEPVAQPLQEPPQIQRIRPQTTWPSALDEAGSVSTSRTGSAYNAYMSEAIAMVHSLFPTQSHRANFMMAAGVWKKIKVNGMSTKDHVKAARELLLRDEGLLRELLIEPTQRTVAMQV